MTVCDHRSLGVPLPDGRNRLQYRFLANINHYIYAKVTMYAIIKDGGRQLKVEVDKRIMIDYRGEQEPGTKIEFNEVLAIGNDGDVKIGQPTVAGAKVVAEVVSEAKGPKLVIAKFRRRKNSKRKTGHRQIYTLVKISEIVS